MSKGLPFRAFLRASSSLVFLLSLAACGGGGGGSSTPAPQPFTIALDRSSISAEYIQGTQPGQQTINATSRGEYNGTIYVGAIIEGQGIDPNVVIAISGTSGTITLSPRANLALGEYTGRVLFLACSDAQCNNRIGGTPLPVNYTVRVLGLVQPAEITRPVTSETVIADLRGSAVVNGVASAGTSPNWQATANAAWLTLTRATGALGTSVEFDLNPAQIANLQNGQEYLATVTIGVPGTALPPVALIVRLQKSLAEIDGAGPHLVLSGQAQRLIIRGQGFASIANLAQRVSIAGIQTVTLTRVNDTTLHADLPPLSAGSYAISASNALGLTTRSYAFAVIDPQTYAYAAIPNSDIMNSLAFDAERHSAYSVSPGRVQLGSNQVVRFRLENGAWVRQAVSVPQLDHAGLSLDGSKLVVTSAGNIQRFDADALALISTLSMNAESSIVREPLAVTNDGRVWFSLAGQLANIDVETEVITVDPNRRSFSGGGPWFAVSRNGERLVVTQNFCCTPRPPMLYLDASEGVIRDVPGDTTGFVAAQLSDDGRRVLFDSALVMDENFAVVGLLQPPPSQPGHIALAGAISPDGSRCYSLNYHNDDFGVPESSRTHPSRVFVYDCSTGVGANPLPILGSFDFPDYPSCWGDFNTCPSVVVTRAISPDGRTLFFIGTRNFVVVPIPETLTPVP